MSYPVCLDVEGMAKATALSIPSCTCAHPDVIHGPGGGCRGAGCMCGWTRDVTGALSESGTGIPAAVLGKLGRRRVELLKIPCYYCGGPSENIDHFVPRSRGGGAGKNRVSACQRCNSMKAAMLYDEFIEQCRKVLAWHEARRKAHQA
jgi:hypothetical protein